jgi:molybdopterin-guanine dinucleotide biosynthesis protein A
MNTASISGLVLAGGRGTRMGNVDKGLQPFGGSTMVAHVLERLRPQVATVAINANQNLDAYGASACRCGRTIRRASPVRWPAWKRACAAAPRLFAAAPCDSPFLPADLAARLLSGLQEADADLALAVTEENGLRQPHPVFCLVKADKAEVYRLPGRRRTPHGWLVPADQGGRGAVRGCQRLPQHQYPRRAAALDPARPTKLADVVSCLSGYDPDALPVRDAQKIIRDFVAPVRATEQVALRAALGRVLAADIVSPINVPAHDNSAMDGYALRGEDLSSEADVRLRVIDTVYAGRASSAVPGAGECVRIMTGGVMPAGCDSVVPQEFVTRGRWRRRHGGRHHPPRRQPPLCRRRPEGRQRGAARKERSSARPTWACWPRWAWPRCRCGGACASPSSRPATSCARSASRWTKAASTTATATPSTACCSAWAATSSTWAWCATTRKRWKRRWRRLRERRRHHHLGRRLGRRGRLHQADHGAPGRRDFWKIGMRPGRPLAFGRIASNGHSAFLFGLPGNPVAVMVSFYFFAREALLRMMGADAPLELVRARSVRFHPQEARPHGIPARRAVARRGRAARGEDHRRAGLGHFALDVGGELHGGAAR